MQMGRRRGGKDRASRAPPEHDRASDKRPDSHASEVHEPRRRRELYLRYTSTDGEAGFVLVDRIVFAEGAKDDTGRYTLIYLLGGIKLTVREDVQTILEAFTDA